MNIAVGLSSLRQPFKKALHIAAEMGATGIEIDARNLLRPSELSDTGRRQLKKMMTDLNLRVAAIRFPTNRGYDVLHDLDRRLDATKEAMKFAYSLGASVLINSVGFVPEKPEHPGYAQLQASLTDLARYGQHVGAMLACETGSEPASRLDALLESLPERAIGVCFNPGNLIVNDYYDEPAIEQCASKVLSVVARDGVRDLARGRGLEVEVGRGSAEFTNIIGVLEQQQYSGWYIVDRPSSEQPIRDIQNAVSFLRAL